MHDYIGGAGMLRGWIALWTDMLWLLAIMTAAIGAMAVIELLIEARNGRTRD